jgi:hypothetical protein
MSDVVAADVVASSSDDGFDWRDDPLWLDSLVGPFGFGGLADRLGTYPSIVYAVVTVSVWTVGSVIYDLSTGLTPIYVENPYFLLQPVVLVGGAFAARSLHEAYGRVTEEMKLADRADDPQKLLDVVPRWLPWVLFGVGAAAQLVRTYLDFAAFDTTGIVANGFVFPFVYLPLIVQFAVVYVGIEFVAPWRLTRSEVGVHFMDPHGVGGMRPLGELVKRAYYYIVVGLVAYALITYAPLVDGWSISAAAGTIFTAVWVVSVATVAFAVLTLHRFMHREKREEIRRLERRLHDHVENPYDVAEYAVPEDAAGEVDDIRQRIERVSATSEYPATFSIWSQLLLSIVIPKAVQLLLASA